MVVFVTLNVTDDKFLAAQNILAFLEDIIIEMVDRLPRIFGDWIDLADGWNKVPSSSALSLKNKAIAKAKGQQIYIAILTGTTPL